MIVVQRRVRAKLRQRPNPEAARQAVGYVDVVSSQDGLSYGHAAPADGMPSPDIGEVGAINALHARR